MELQRWLCCNHSCDWCFLASSGATALEFAGLSAVRQSARLARKPACLAYTYSTMDVIKKLLVHRFMPTRRNTLIDRDSARRRSLRRSRSFKVTDFGTNRKPICDFLLANNTNLYPISHRFQVTTDFGQIYSLLTGGP